jgi:hypothetical protein
MHLVDGSLGLLGAHGVGGGHFPLATALALAASGRDSEQVASAALRYKDFPPGWGHIKVPVSSRRAAVAALGLYSPCRPRALWAQWAARAWVELFGPTALPGRSFPWVPMDRLQWLELADTWRRELGEFDEVAGYTRLQTSRGGLAILLLRAGSPVAFVKLRQGDCAALSNEHLALQAAWTYRPRAFRVPKPLQSGNTAGWSYLVSAPLPPGLHRPHQKPPLRAIAEEVEAALAGLPRPAEARPHWRPMHGDFTPWNLRQLPGGSLVLVDWENAGWGPPGADETLYQATRAALRARAAERCDRNEAVQFWRDRLPSQASDARDRRLAEALRVALGGMADS